MKKPPRYSPKDIRNIRVGSVLTMLICVFVLLIPDFYEWTAEIPPFEQLQIASGDLTYQKVGKNKNEWLTGLKSASGETYFTCAAGIGHPDCLLPVSEYTRLAGKPTTIWWFEQPVYLFVTHKRAVRLVVDGDEKVSYEKTLVVAKKNAKFAIWMAFIELGLFISIVVWFELRIREQKNEQ